MENVKSPVISELMNLWAPLCSHYSGKTVLRWHTEHFEWLHPYSTFYGNLKLVVSFSPKKMSSYYILLIYFSKNCSAMPPHPFKPANTSQRHASGLLIIYPFIPIRSLLLKDFLPKLSKDTKRTIRSEKGNHTTDKKKRSVMRQWSVKEHKLTTGCDASRLE